MNKYVVILSNKTRGSLNDELLMEHVNHLKKLRSKGVLYLCGPYKDNDGALQILLSDNKENAEKLIQSDPFIMHKYYQDYTISELIEANEENNYLIEDTQTILNKKV